MNRLTAHLSDILLRHLPAESTSVSYAIMRHGKILAADALGYQNRITEEKADLNCTYNVASISKVYCTVACMQMIRKGAFTLDTPVCQILPEFEMPLDPRYRKITLRHCLNHSSGLPGTQWRNHFVTDIHGIDFYHEIYDYLRKSTLKAEPGTYSVYCNDGFQLAEMCVARASGMSYGEYLRKYITDPIQAPTTGTAQYPGSKGVRIAEGKGPEEYLCDGGVGGVTTSMPDLCRFGNQFLIHDSPILNDAEKKEMDRPQGTTFLKKDQGSCQYGLGWDCVNLKADHYDLGSHVLIKGGDSFQFYSQFIVIPKYDAVLSASMTHDCRLDLRELLLRLFAETLAETDHICIRRHAELIPAEIRRKIQGTWLRQNLCFTLHADQTAVDFTYQAPAPSPCFLSGMIYDGKQFLDPCGVPYDFESHGRHLFLLQEKDGRMTGSAMHAEKYTPDRTWNARIGKYYFVTDGCACDLFLHDAFTVFSVQKPEHTEGIYLLRFNNYGDDGAAGVFDSPVKAISPDRGRTFLLTPNGPSRDSMDPYFYQENGRECCDVASYHYIEESALPLYRGQKLKKSCVMRIQKLNTCPEADRDLRILILNSQMKCVYDSLYQTNFVPVKEGYLFLLPPASLSKISNEKALCRIT